MKTNNQPATKEDIKKLATKAELKSEIALVRLDMKDMEERLDEKNKGYRDEILTKMDGIAADLQAKREDDAAGAKILEDHEKRISALEAA